MRNGIAGPLLPGSRVEGGKRRAAWKGDLIVSAGSRSAIGTLVDHASRYLLLMHLPINRSVEAMRNALIDVLGTVPESMRLTLTWDQGSELAYHDQIAPLLREGVFFAYPASP